MLKTTIAAIAACLVLCLPAEARPARASVQTEFCGDRYCASGQAGMVNPEQPGRVTRQRFDGQIVAHPTGCPATRFCGCGAAIYVFGRNVRDLWPVSSWRRFPHASPGPGMAAVWDSHVAIIIEAHGDGTATMYDANTSVGRVKHLTLIHRRPLAGASIRNPKAAVIASR